MSSLTSANGSSLEISEEQILNVNGTIFYWVIFRVVGSGALYLKAQSNLCLKDFTYHVEKSAIARGPKGIVKSTLIGKSTSQYYMINYGREMCIIVKERQDSIHHSNKLVSFNQLCQDVA